VAKKKRLSQLQHQLLPQHLLLLLMQHLQQLQLPLLLVPLLLLQHQPASNSCRKQKSRCKAAFFTSQSRLPAYLISCSSSKVRSLYPAGVFSGLPASS
jgi:hypothetical protein